MKKVSLVLAVALGLAVATLAGLWSSSSASAGEFEDGLKCYKTQHVEILDQNSSISLSQLYISDQFQERNLIVKKPIAFCTLADKGFRAPDAGDAGQPRATDLLCYETKDAPGQARFQTQRLEVSDQFKGSFLVLTKPYALCESATKGGGGGSVAGGPLDDYEFRCYKARREENGEPFRKISVTLFDQFEQGGKDVRLGRPTVFCTQVFEKKNKAKNNHIDHAALVDPPELFHASTISATNDRSDPRISCAEPGGLNYGHSVWFTYTPGEDVKFHLNTENSTYDTVVAIFRGDPANGDEVDCNDDYYDLTSRIDTKLEAYNKYYILVGAWAGTPGGKLKLNIETGDACDQSNLCGAGSTAATNVVDLGDVGDAAAAPEILDLNCYSLSQPAPDTDDVQTGDQLTLSQFALGRGIMYCTPVYQKCVIHNQPLAPEIQAAGCDT